MQIADLAPLCGDLIRHLAQHRLALLAPGQQLGVLVLLPCFAGRQLRGLLPGVGGERLLALQGGFDLQQNLAARPANRLEVVQISSQLIGVVAVEEQAHWIGVATQVLSIEQFFQLCLLRAQPLFEFT